MGAGASKPGDASKQVFTSENPVQFSQDLIDSLQASSETNSTRQKSLDLHIQQRVAAELARLQDEQSSLLEAARKKISSDTSDDSSSAFSKDSSSSTSSGLLSKLPSVSPKDLFSTDSKEEKKRKEASSKSVTDEIEKLKKALGERKVMKDLPKEVEAARQGVITCLRFNDRQSLDCWQEVEVFKREVRKLEEQFVGRVL